MRRMVWIGAFVLSACSGGSGNPNQFDSGPVIVTDPMGPQFLSFGTNVQQLTEGESLVFSAVLTDPDGIDDIIGGELKDTTGAVTFGTFQTSAQEGAYSLTLTWAAIHQAVNIEFATEENVTFRAEFYDVAGHRNSSDLSIRLHCAGRPRATEHAPTSPPRWITAEAAATHARIASVAPHAWTASALSRATVSS